MKNIKEYIGKKVAVECENKEDWDKLIKLTDSKYPNYFDKCPVGRYFKALADNINNSHVIKGNYYKIERTSKSFIYFFTEFTNQAIYSIHESKYHLLEFMPEGWTPESKQYDYEVVHCKTQEEWDFVRNKTTKEYSYEWHEALSYSKELALHIDGKGWSRLSYYQETNSKIYSFEEWCTKFGHTYELPKPEYVECIKDLDRVTLKGRIYKARYDPAFEWFVGNMPDATVDWNCVGGTNMKAEYFKASTKEAYEAQNKPKKTSTEWIPKLGDWVECIKEEGFKSDSKNYLIESGIKLGQKYQVIGYVKEYNYVDGKGIQLNGYICTHPLTSFKPYQEIPTTAYTGVDYSSPKVTIGNTAIDIIAPKKSNSVTLGQIQKEIKINVNFKKPVKI